MRAVLNMPGNVPVARDNLIKQETTLAELDLAIDEWTEKLRTIEGRRWQIQQKLSEHVTAVLALQLPGSDARRVSEEQTPPRSPEKLLGDCNSEEARDEVQIERETRRDEVESIRIYADSGVASLLKSIEQEIDLMDQRMRSH